MGDGEDDVAGGGVGLVAIAGEGPVAADLDVARRVVQIDVEGAACREVRRRGEAEQALLAAGQDLGGDVEEGRRCDRPGRRVQDPDVAGLLDDEDPAASVRHRREEDRRIEAGADAGDPEGVGADIGDGDGKIEHRAGGAVADRDLDQIDVVLVGVGREFEIRRSREGERAAAGDREGGTVGAARKREGQRVAVRIGGGGLIDGAGAVLRSIGGRGRGDRGRPIGLRLAAATTAAPAAAGRQSEQSGEDERPRPHDAAPPPDFLRNRLTHETLI